MPDIIVETLDAPIVVEDISSTPSVITLASTGPRGVPGPDPWLEGIQDLTANGGTLLIDYAAGKHVRLDLQADTIIDVENWPIVNRIARLTIEVDNAGAFQITGWPTGTRGQNGQTPVLTTGGEDTIVLTTTDGGATINLYIAGLNFQLLA